MRALLTSILEMLGLAAVSVGSFVEFGAGVGLIVSGVCAVVLGMVLA